MGAVLLQGREEMEMERRGNTCVDGICMWRFERREGILIFMGWLLKALNMAGKKTITRGHKQRIHVHFEITGGREAMCCETHLAFSALVDGGTICFDSLHSQLIEPACLLVFQHESAQGNSGLVKADGEITKGD